MTKKKRRKKQMERTIKIAGTGKITVKPDMTIMNLSFSNVYPTYEKH